jgi:hypothetical protein
VSAGLTAVGRGYEIDVRIGAVILVIWLIVGLIATGQRGYLNSSETNCARAGTIIVTIIAGPLNYLGVNPKVTCGPGVPSST